MISKEREEIVHKKLAPMPFDINEDDEDTYRPREKYVPGGLSTAEMMASSMDMNDYLKSLGIGRMSIKKEKEIEARPGTKEKKIK